MSIRIIPPAKLPDYGIVTGDRQRRRLENLGEFPRRVPITGRSHGYLETELQDFIAKKVAQRGGAA
jgi:hypothetical protein